MSTTTEYPIKNMGRAKLYALEFDGVVAIGIDKEEATVITDYISPMSLYPIIIRLLGAAVRILNLRDTTTLIARLHSATRSLTSLVEEERLIQRKGNPL